MHLSTFIGQKSYERVEYILRRDPITFVPRAIFLTLLIVLPLLLALMTMSQFPSLLQNQSVFAASIIGGSIYLLSVLVIFHTIFIDFYLDISIVTNDRIIDVTHTGLFSRKIAEFDLFRIQDVSADVHGLFASLFNYGNLHIKTASTTADLVFNNIPNPNFLRGELIRLSNEDRKFHNAREA